MTRDNIRTAFGEARDTRDPVTLEQAAQMRVPMLLIGGANSLPRFAPVLEALERSIPDVQRAIIPDAGHTMYRSTPEAFNAAVLSFVAVH